MAAILQTPWNYFFEIRNLHNGEINERRFGSIFIEYCSIDELVKLSQKHVNQ